MMTRVGLQCIYILQYDVVCWMTLVKEIMYLSGDPFLQTQHPIFDHSDVVMRHCASVGDAALLSRGLRALVFISHLLTCQWTLLTFSWALVSFFCTLLATFPAVSPFPKFNSAILQRRSVFGYAGRKEIKGNNDRLDRYGDRLSKFINVQLRNNGDECMYVLCDPLMCL